MTECFFSVSEHMGAGEAVQKYDSTQSRVKGCCLPTNKIQMGPFNISKHLGRWVFFRAS